MAKEILAVLVFASFIALIACQEYVKGSPVRRVRGRSGVVTDFKCQSVPTPNECNICKTKFGQACSDCKTTMLCFGKPLMAQPCAMLDPSKPYCRDTDGECVAEEPVPTTGVVPGSSTTAAPQSTSCNLLDASDFKCTGEGQFPNPDDCTKYYYCDGAGVNQATGYECPSSYVYDSKSGLCKQKKIAADCKIINCKNHTNQYQIFDADKSVLALCLQSGETTEKILFRCKDPINMEYDEHLKCKFICKAEGRFPIEGDTTKYFECYRNGTVLVSTIQECRPGYSFNKDLKICKK